MPGAGKGKDGAGAECLRPEKNLRHLSNCTVWFSKALENGEKTVIKSSDTSNGSWQRQNLLFFSVSFSIFFPYEMVIQELTSNMGITGELV